ncbi:hypothetical protein J1N35_044784 [Gossypium stocksii]|uniref:Uncharacterized protein n=1 Tax=Gossypium stocksii TaxID=47602 RepID=A0A9D3UA17_9ROSI|nr:hypothetical protein J1N35_044784 [Gossypium stocksii]
MPRTRGGSSGWVIPSYPLQQYVTRVLIKPNFYTYTTKTEEMFQALEVRRIKIPNFAYDFSVPVGLHRLSETNGNNFLLPLHAIKENFSPNEWKVGDNNEVVNAIGVQSKIFTWPYGAKDDLRLMLLGYKEEPRNYFNSYCKLRLHPWFSLPSPYVESHVNPNLFTVIVDPRIVGGAGVFGTIIEHGVTSALVKFVAIGGENGELFPWREHISMREFFYSLNNGTNHLMISLLEEIKECMCLGGSSSGVKKPSLQELAFSLQFLLVEASIVGLGFKESISRAEVITSGHFDARRVKFDALYDIADDQLGFDIHFTFGATWEEFAFNWRNFKYFYLDEDPIETSVTPTNEDDNNKAGEGSTRENEASSIPEETLRPPSIVDF